MPAKMGLKAWFWHRRCTAGISSYCLQRQMWLAQLKPISLLRRGLVLKDLASSKKQEQGCKETVRHLCTLETYTGAYVVPVRNHWAFLPRISGQHRLAPVQCSGCTHYSSAPFPMLRSEAEIRASMEILSQARKPSELKMIPGPILPPSYLQRGITNNQALSYSLLESDPGVVPHPLRIIYAGGTQQ